MPTLGDFLNDEFKLDAVPFTQDMRLNLAYFTEAVDDDMRDAAKSGVRFGDDISRRVREFARAIEEGARELIVSEEREGREDGK